MSAELKNRIKGKPEIQKAAETEDGAVQLVWKETPGAQVYFVEKYNRETEKFEKLIRLTEEILTYTDEDVEPGGVYRYRILAKRKNKDGEVLAKRGAAVVVTVAISDCVELTEAAHPQFGVVHLQWEKDPEADGYRINRRLAESASALPLAYVEGQRLRYTDKTPVSGQIYFYSVQSFRRTDEDDELLFSHCGEERMIVNLDRPEILEIRRGLGHSVSFSLRVTAGADSYVLYKSSRADGEFREVCRSKSITDLRLTDKGKHGERGAFYCVKCMRRYQGEEYFGESTAPVYVKY